MILAALQSVPDEMLEAASLDGAGKVRQLFSIIIPYISMTLLLTILLRIIWIFNFPDIIYAMTNGGPANQTHIVTTWMINYTSRATTASRVRSDSSWSRSCSCSARST